MGKWFSYDGWLIQFLTKVGELALVSMMFLLCCVPLVTAGASAASLYYAVMKSIRRERGGPLREFWRSMKRTAGKGILYTVGIAVIGILLYIGFTYAQAAEKSHMQAVYIAFGIVLAGVSVYVFPVLSRFEMRSVGIWKLAFVMAIRFLPYTAAILAGAAAMVWLWFYWLPIPCILILPGIGCLLASFPMERALLAYTPEAKDGKKQWYDKPDKPENSDKEKKKRRRGKA